MSIRSRLAIAVALVLVLTFALSGVALVRSTRQTLVDQVDQQVLANANHANGQDGMPPDGGQENDQPPPKPTASSTEVANSTETADSASNVGERTVARFVYSSSGTLVVDEPCGFADDPKAPPVLPAIPGPEVDLLVNKIVTTPAADNSFQYRMLVERDQTGAYVVTAASLESVDSAVSRLERIFFGIGAVGLIVATVGAWWLIRRGLRPVDRMVDMAAAIAEGDLSLRAPDADPRTELGRLGGALNEMLHQIEVGVSARVEAESRLRRFVSDAAHELRTPLTSVRGYAELFRQGAFTDETGVSNAMRRIEAEGARMARLVDDLLLLARLDEQPGVEAKPVDVAAIAREAIGDFRAVEPDRPVTEAIFEPAMVLGDRVRIRQIVDNLLANTRIHTPAGTPVNLGVETIGSDVVLSVADQGPGISSSDQARIFERFWRADPARSRAKGGTGLGLAIVASLVESQGGSIEVVSELGAGATFRVSFTRATASPTSPEPVSSK